MAGDGALRSRTTERLVNLAAEVKERRLALDLNQRDAAAEIGVYFTDLCRFERGALDLRITTAIKYLEWLDRENEWCLHCDGSLDECRCFD